MHGTIRNYLFTWLALALVLAPAPTNAAEHRAETTKDIPDAQISLAVESELMADDGVPANRIDVETDQGIVTLSGTVESMLARERALTLARQIKGVVRVVDQLTVNAVRRPDEALRDDVKEALFLDPATETQTFEVDVSEGVVTLTGVVRSFVEKRAALAAAEGVRGVTDVIDRIEVRLAVERPDHQIELDIEEALDSDARLNDEPIEVSVKDGDVTLSGAVSSAAQKSLAERRAWVGGVRSVDITGLQVKWWQDNTKAVDRAQESKFGSLDDERLTSSVQRAILHEPEVNAKDVHVSISDGGVVTLRGEVGSLRSRRMAERAAQEIVGVWRVRNHLRVRPKETPGDEELAERARRALARDPYVERHAIDVTARNGRVFLRGTVDTVFEREHAAEVVAGLRGVSDLEARLAVRDEWRPKPDWAIQRDIEDELWWSPLVDSEAIDVVVEDGVATLRGTVDTPIEQRAAIDKAREAGARSVVDEMKVKLLP